MKKRLLCLFLGLIMVLSVVLTACSGGDEEEADVEEDMGAQTITMRLVSEKRVCNTDEEFAAYCKELKDSGLKADSAEYKAKVKEMEDRMAAYEAVEYAFSKLTKSKYKINVDLMFYTEAEYEKTLSATMDKYALETKKIERAEKALAKYIADYQEWWTKKGYVDEFPTDLVTKDFYERYPEYEEFKGKSSEENEDIYFEEQYKENEDGIQELVYPETEPNQLDIIYLSGSDMYKDYINNEWIIDLNSLMSTTGKKLNDYITGALLNGVKVDGMTYAIPNNVQIGQYTYMLVDKNLYDTYYGPDFTKVEDVLDIGVFLRDIVENENDSEDPKENIIPINATFDECISQFVWYWNFDQTLALDENGDPLLGEKYTYDKEGNIAKTEYETIALGYDINRSNEFSLIGSLYGNPKTAGRGQIEYGFNTLFLDTTYRNIFVSLKEYEYNGYFVKENDERDVEKAAVRFVQGDYSIKKQTLDNKGVYTDENGKEYYAYVVKYPEVDETALYGNMFAISANSVRTQACMQIITLINTNAEARNILQYGVEGVNFMIDETEEGDKVLKRLNNDYMMSIERTGNCFIAYPDPRNGENLTMDYWENAKNQNNDALINPLLGFDMTAELGLNELAALDSESIVEEYSGYLDIDFGEWTSMKSASKYILEDINECTSVEELNAYLDNQLLALDALGAILQGGEVCYLPIDYNGTFLDYGQGGSVKMPKLTNKNYSTAGSEDVAPDLNGESPYAIYYQWMLANSFYPGVSE